MKYILTFILFTFCMFSAMSQTYTFNVTNSICNGYDLSVNSDIIANTGDCMFSTDLNTNQIYEVSAVAQPSSGLAGISTLDLVLIQRGILNGFDSDLEAYLADFDQDGAVSSYDLVTLRAVILGLTQTDGTYHIIDNNTVIPTIDPFDIQVDYSKIDCVSADFINSNKDIQILKIGDLR